MNVDGVIPKMFSMIGIGESTLGSLKLGDRNVLDKMSGYWPDGEIKKRNFDDGDGTVLPRSGKFDNQEFENISSNHGDIVDKSLWQILTRLGLGTTIGNEPSQNNFSRKLVFFADPKINLSIFCGQSNSVSVEENFWLIKSGNSNCRIDIFGKESGASKLVWGNSETEDGWHGLEKNLGKGETMTFVVDAMTGDFSLGSERALYELIREDANLLKDKYKDNRHLVKILKAVEKNEIRVIEMEVFQFRRETGETLISPGIIDNVVKIMIIEKIKLPHNTRNIMDISRREYEFIEWWFNYKQKFDKTISKNMVMSFKMMSDYFEMEKIANNHGRFQEVMVLGEIIDELFREMWWR